MDEKRETLHGFSSSLWLTFQKIHFLKIFSSKESNISQQKNNNLQCIKRDLELLTLHWVFVVSSKCQTRAIDTQDTSERNGTKQKKKETRSQRMDNRGDWPWSVTIVQNIASVDDGRNIAARFNPRPSRHSYEWTTLAWQFVFPFQTTWCSVEDIILFFYVKDIFIYRMTRNLTSPGQHGVRKIKLKLRNISRQVANFVAEHNSLQIQSCSITRQRTLSNNNFIKHLVVLEGFDEIKIGHFLYISEDVLHILWCKKWPKSARASSHFRPKVSLYASAWDVRLWSFCTMW